MAIIDRPPAYKAYLLRCWLEGANWRYSLEEVGSGRRHGFATLDELVTFLVAMSSTKVEGVPSPKVKSAPPKTDSGAFTGAGPSSKDER